MPILCPVETCCNFTNKDISESDNDKVCWSLSKNSSHCVVSLTAMSLEAASIIAMHVFINGDCLPGISYLWLDKFNLTSAVPYPNYQLPGLPWFKKHSSIQNQSTSSCISQMHSALRLVMVLLAISTSSFQSENQQV